MREPPAEIINQEKRQREYSECPPRSRWCAHLRTDHATEPRSHPSQNQNAPNPQIAETVQIEVKPARGKWQQKADAVGIGPIEQQMARNADQAKPPSPFPTAHAARKRAHH